MVDRIPPRRNEIITRDGEMTVRFSRYLETLTDTVNVVVEEVDDVTSSEDVYNDAIGINTQELIEDEVFAPIDVFVPTWNATTAIDTYYATVWDYVEAQTSAIYLPQYPDLNDQVIVASDYDQNVVIYGNGNKVKVVKQEDSISVVQKGTSLTFIYFGDYWRII